MSFLSRIFEQRSNPFENPVVSLSTNGWLAWMDNEGPTASGESISELSAMQISTVYRCVTLIASSIAAMPCKLYEVSPGAGRTEAYDNYLYDILRHEASDDTTSLVFWESMFGALALTGNAYAQITRNPATGQVTGLYPLHPLQTKPFRNADKSISYRTTDGEQVGKYRIIASADVLHIPLFSFDGLLGLSPIQQARHSLGLTRAAEKYGARFFGNGSRPGGVLSTSATLTDAAKAQAKESWLAAQGGTNQGKTAVLVGDWTYQQIGLSPEESQFLETRKFQRAEIAALFGLAPHQVGDLARLSNANHVQEALSFVQDCLMQYISRAEAEIRRKLLPKLGRKAGMFEARFDVSERLRGDFASTATGLQTAVLTGIMSRNEARHRLGLNPGGPELDVFMVPVNEQAATAIPTEPVTPTTSQEPAETDE